MTAGCRKVGMSLPICAPVVAASNTPTQLVSAAARMWLATALALAVVLLVPFFVVDVPPVLDYPNHLARFFILAHPDDPVLSKMYAPHWTVLPNLGVDLIGAALLRMTDAHTGGRMLLALSLMSPVAGAIIYHRTVFGTRSYWPLASGLVAYNACFFLGFMNYLLSLGLALAGAAAWIALRRRDRSGWKAVAGAVAAIVTFFSHIFGLALLFLLIAADEVAELWRRHESGTLTPRAFLKAAVPMLVALGPVVVLYGMSPFGDKATTFGAWRAISKVMRLVSPFMTTSVALTLVTTVAVAVVLIAMRRRITFAPGLPLVLAVLAIVYVAAPLRLKGGSFIDLRVALMFALLLFAGIQPRIARREAMFVAFTLAALICVRSAYVGATWIDHRKDVADLRAAIASVEPGARVLVATGYQGEVAQADPERRALFGIYRLTRHLPALLAIERSAFWPTLFADPSQQPVTVLPPFRRISTPLGEPLDWSTLASERYSEETLQFAPYLARWRADFDYVLLIDPTPEPEHIAKLSSLYDGNFAKLYRIDH